MKIIKLIPRGFCQGVVNAINVLNDALINYAEKNIYCLGWIVHNENVVQEFINKGVKFLDDKNTSRYDLIKNLNDENAVVVFSAHGTADDVFTLAKNKGFIVLDSTCKYVSKIHEIIKAKMEEYKIIFIGKKNHPESIASLSINKDIIFIDIDEARNNKSYENLNLDKNKKYYLLNQTTISIFDYYEIIKYFKTHYTNIEYDCEICDATSKRQEADLKMDNDVELLIVVGDQKSNNSNQLVYLAKTKQIPSYLVNNKQELNKAWFLNKNKIAITAENEEYGNLAADASANTAA